MGDFSTGHRGGRTERCVDSLGTEITCAHQVCRHRFASVDDTRRTEFSVAAIAFDIIYIVLCRNAEVKSNRVDYDPDACANVIARFARTPAAALTRRP
jgi:hypothetical protein